MTASSEMTTVVGSVVESEPVLGHVVQSQPHGSYNNTKYMASPGKIEEFRNLKDEADRSYCCCKSTVCKGFLTTARHMAFTPPWTLHFGIAAFIFGPIGCLCELSPCDPCAKTTVPVPSEILKQNPVATITPDGVIVDTFFELNDEADTQSTLIPWVNILSVSVRKPRKHLRSCGTCECIKGIESAPFEGIAFTCDVKTGLLVPCISVICNEKGIEDYSEVIIYSSKSGYLSSSQLINSDPTLVTKCQTLNDQGKEFLVGTDITKVNVMALLQVDQFVADIQSVGANYRNGAPVPVHENKVHLVHNPEAGTTSSGYMGGDGGVSGAG